MIKENQMENNMQQWKPKVLRDTEPHPFEWTVVSISPLLGLYVTFGVSGSLASWLGRYKSV